MSRKPKFPPEEKLKIVNRYLEGERPSILVRTYGINEETLRTWVKKYQLEGFKGLCTNHFNQSYSRAFKLQVIQEYLSGAGSSRDLALKYEIKSRATVSKWIERYNGHEDTLKSYNGGKIHMTKGRKTTFEERIKIVEYCIEHDLNYTQTAEQFQVSYSQVYSWVKKYKDKGVNALKDNRGKGKPIEDMNETERLKAENKLLDAQNRQLQMENDLLKKIKELERGQRSVIFDKKKNI